MGDEPSHCITTKLELLLDNDQHIAFVNIYGPHDVCRPKFYRELSDLLTSFGDCTDRGRFIACGGFNCFEILFQH